MKALGLNSLDFATRETGDFVDFNDNRNIFPGTFSGSGAATGPVILFLGARFPVGPAS